MFTLDLINALKITNHNTKTPKTPKYISNVHSFLFSKLYTFSKIGHSFDSAFSDHVYGQAGFCLKLFPLLLLKTAFRHYDLCVQRHLTMPMGGRDGTGASLPHFVSESLASRPLPW